MSNIVSYIQDTTDDNNCNDLDVGCYIVYEDHIKIFLRNIDFEHNIQKILGGKEKYPTLYFNLVLDGNVFFDCQGKVLSDNLLIYEITFKSKQNVN